MDVVINANSLSIPEQSKPLNSEGSAVLNFLKCLGYDPQNPPFADLLRRSHYLEGDWLILSPISWSATHNDAMIVAANQDLCLGEEIAGHWFQLYAKYLAEDNIQLFYHNAEIWLLKTTDTPPLNAKPVHHLLNHSLMPELAQLDPSMYWQKFFTEAQMFFAAHSDKPAINGVWLWGSAPLVNKKSIAICADEFLFPIAQICSENVTLYHPSVSLPHYSILLISDINVLSKPHQEELKTKPASWYWNNAAYLMNKFSWLTRLWRTLTHAH